MYVMNLKAIKRERDRVNCRNRLFYRLRSRLQYKQKQNFLSTASLLWSFSTLPHRDGIS